MMFGGKSGFTMVTQMSLTDEYDPGGHDVYGGLPPRRPCRCTGVAPKEVIHRGGSTPRRPYTGMGYPRRSYEGVEVPQGATCGGRGLPKEPCAEEGGAPEARTSTLSRIWSDWQCGKLLY